jgi:hypothetical protein
MRQIAVVTMFALLAACGGGNAVPLLAVPTQRPTPTASASARPTPTPTPSGPAVASYGLVIQGTPPATFQSGMLTMDGVNATVTLGVVALDAHNNAISGAALPTVSSAIVGGNSAYVAGANGSAISITTPLKGSRTPATVALSLSGASCPSVVGCSRTITASMTEFVAVSDNGTKEIQVYSERTKAFTSTIAVPAALDTFAAFDPFGNLWMDGGYSEYVYEFTPPYTDMPKTPLPVDVGESVGLVAFDANADMFLALSDGEPAPVIEFAYPSYTASMPIVSDSNSPYGLLVDAGSDLWVANPFNTAGLDQAVQYVAAPIGPSRVTTLPSLGCSGIVQDSAGYIDLLCETPSHGGRIDRYSQSGVPIGSVAIGTSPFAFIAALPASAGTGVILSGSNAGSVGSWIFGSSASVAPLTIPGTSEGVATDASGTTFIVQVNAGGTSGGLYSVALPGGTPQALNTSFKRPRDVTIWP